MTPAERDDFADLPFLADFGAVLDEVMAREDAAARMAAPAPPSTPAPAPASGAARQPTGGSTSRPLWRRRLRRRGLLIGVATLVATGSAMAATVRLITHDARPISVSRYLGHGDLYDCAELPSQAVAQAILRADPSDPNRLDEEPGGITADRDGIACPQLPPPNDHKAVRAIVDGFRCRPDDTRTARCPQPSRPFDPRAFLGASAFDLYDCDDFATQADAQAVLRFQPEDPEHLDGDRDGIACPGRPGPRDTRPVPRGTT